MTTNRIGLDSQRSKELANLLGIYLQITLHFIKMLEGITGILKVRSFLSCI